MTYELRKFEPAHGIDVYVDPETKEVDRDEHKPLLFGSFFMGFAGDLQFHQTEKYLFDLEDIKLIAHISEQIQGEGFEKIYNEAK